MKKHISLPILFVALFSVISCTNPSGNLQDASITKEASLVDSSSVAKLLPGLQDYLKDIESKFSTIPDERKDQLKKIALYVKTKQASNEPSNLIFICTHNSRRSHMSQFWAQTAAYYHGLENVHCFSGGTEVTAFNPRSVKALRKAGFTIEQTDSTSNPVYLGYYADDVTPVKGFSKIYDNEYNPRENFVAIMTCSEADKTCPRVDGASLRVAIPYEDPKIADNTPEEEQKYDERCFQIASEMFYVFSLVKTI